MSDTWNNLLRSITLSTETDTYRSAEIQLGAGLQLNRISDQKVRVALANPVDSFSVWDSGAEIANKQASVNPLQQIALVGGTAFGINVPADGDALRWAVRVPFGFRLTEVRVLIDPATHANMPATKPVVSVFSVSLNPTWQSSLEGEVTEPLAAVGTYNTPHYIEVTGLDVFIPSGSADSPNPESQKQVEVRITPEEGANALNLVVLGALYKFEPIGYNAANPLASVDVPQPELVDEGRYAQVENGDIVWSPLPGDLQQPELADEGKYARVENGDIVWSPVLGDAYGLNGLLQLFPDENTTDTSVLLTDALVQVLVDSGTVFFLTADSHRINNAILTTDSSGVLVHRLPGEAVSVADASGSVQTTDATETLLARVSVPVDERVELGVLVTGEVSGDPQIERSINVMAKRRSEALVIEALDGFATDEVGSTTEVKAVETVVSDAAFDPNIFAPPSVFYIRSTGGSLPDVDAGDTIRVTEHSNAANNGIYKVLGVDTANSDIVVESVGGTPASSAAESVTIETGVGLYFTGAVSTTIDLDWEYQIKRRGF